MDRAGLGVNRFPPVEDQTRDAVVGKQSRGGGTGGTGSDDDDGEELRHAYFTGVRWVPRSRAPSSVATASSTTSPCWRYLSLRACCLKNAFHLTAGGNRLEIIWTGFGGALRAVPTGVPVMMRSPAFRFWNRVRACRACRGWYIMSPSTSMFCRTSPLTRSCRRRSPKRLSASA